MSTMVNDPRLISTESQSGGPIAALRRRLSYADLGQLPVIIGLLVIWGIFQTANNNFLTPLNLTNLLLQYVALGIMAVGIILVLLLGEIDLSVGLVSGLCGGIMAVMNVKNGWPGWLAIAAALLAGLLIGTLQGVWIAKLRVPSFIVTLAGWLAWQGALLLILGNTGTINLRDQSILGLTNTFFPAPVGWAAAVLFVGIFAFFVVLETQKRRVAGLTYNSLPVMIGRIAIVAVPVFVGMLVLNANRGLPLAVIILLSVIVLFNWITKRTTYGRHIYAVGGNAEAARRASINVDWIRISVFMICSTLGALGGVMAGARLLSVNQSSGGGDLLLNVVAAAVIGGTSLFGGRGSIWAALLGALVIGSISNGMDLLALQSSAKYMITGGVLLLAVTIDALSRRRRAATGR